MELALSCPEIQQRSLQDLNEEIKEHIKNLEIDQDQLVLKSAL